MSTHEIATRLAVLKVLSDLVKTQTDDAKTSVTEQMTPGDRLTATLPDGTKVASVTMAEPRASVKVVDEAAFVAWVAEEYPGEIVQAVRESFRTKVLDAVRRNGAPIDHNGAVTRGVEIVERDPYVTVRPTSGASEAVAQAWRDGTVQLGALPELE